MTVMQDDTVSTIADVVVQITTLRNVNIQDVVCSFKKKRISETRFMIYAYLHNELGISASKIGKYFNRPRRSILRGIQILKEWMQYHTDIKNEYGILVEKLKGGD